MIHNCRFIRGIGAVARMLPVLAWLAMQGSMASMPAHAAKTSYSDQLAALFQTLEVDQIVLCLPDGQQVFKRHDHHKTQHGECGWCQGFAAATLPGGPIEVALVAPLSGASDRLLKPNAHKDMRGRPCPPSRAPPSRE